MSAAGFRAYNVLFICRHNSARGLMAECALRRWANGRFHAYSAGREPASFPNPSAIAVLRSFNHKVDTLRPKSWAEFMTETAPMMDFVFIVDEGVSLEDLPAFPGSPMCAVWPIDDPFDVQGTDERRARAFRAAYLEIESRCKIFTSLRVDGLDKLTLQSSLDFIGERTSSKAGADAETV